MRLPDLLGPIELPAAELEALRLDGTLYCLAGVWRPSDLPETGEARAAAVALTLRDRLVADRLTAAWVLGAAERVPSPLQCCVPIEDRGAAGTPQLDIREVRLADGDVLRIGDLRLTSPLRTAVDLLGGEAWGEGVSGVVARLLRTESRNRLGRMLEERRFSTHRARRVRRLTRMADDPASPGDGN
ncbi:type IV toxin-antitoxin system AbiEi family antitoxin [Naasia sp. SYSU D00948]|uniref:type IV toxin-antitoxin system AbiEi family antitoxin n=1 Tax=Naasia sp. SYSU D00948 TaxID=2817379 RepID=UPI001B312D36|nr:type IV toxin-antitoxin system AbiEi family antitoxin [Naasia sp. SYSU D00948]